ncbi:MAG: hypothetical protein ACYDED_00885 [Ferrimicrobium sp.]
MPRICVTNDLGVDRCAICEGTQLFDLFDGDRPIEVAEGPSQSVDMVAMPHCRRCGCVERETYRAKEGCLSFEARSNDAGHRPHAAELVDRGI